MAEVNRVGDISLLWGESLRWDDRRQRLYFVDCATATLHWLEGGDPPLHSFTLPSLATGVVIADDGRLVVALDDGLHVVDADAETSERLAPYPAALGRRANDANADLDGNLVTGTLNTDPGDGSCWWYSSGDGWRQLDAGISNTNGPAVIRNGGHDTLVVADTHASALYAYDYDGNAGTAGPRRRFADTSELGAVPDGACVDGDGAVWSCMLGAGAVARYGEGGLTDRIDATVELPADVTFGGADLDRMFVVSIAVPVGGVEVSSPNAGAVLAIDGTGYRGRPEPRFRL